jgi:uncharacterized protein YeaO (DUF488 family)
VIKVKSVYDQTELSDGVRILVDRVWPRGVKSISTWIDDWRWDLAPSPALRKWFHRDPRKWDAFKRRYRHELEVRDKMGDLRTLAERAKEETITFLFTTGNEEYNGAAVLKELLEKLRL